MITVVEIWTFHGVEAGRRARVVSLDWICNRFCLVNQTLTDIVIILGFSKFLDLTHGVTDSWICYVSTVQYQKVAAFLEEWIAHIFYGRS